jgi:hypothetical protein
MSLLWVYILHELIHCRLLHDQLQTCIQGRRKQCEAAGVAISKGHLLLSNHFSGRQYLLKLYCMDTRLLVAIVGQQTSTLILNNFICCTMLRARIKSVNRRILPGLALIRGRQTGRQWGHVPHHFFKREKMPFWGARKELPFLQ